MNIQKWLIVGVVLVHGLVGCSKEEGTSATDDKGDTAGGDADTDGDADMDADGDADTDGDADADGDGDGDGDADSDGDTDTVTDSDADGDGDGDGDADSDGDTDTVTDSASQGDTETVSQRASDPTMDTDTQEQTATDTDVTVGTDPYIDCPDSPPDNGAPCTEYLYCMYGDDPREACRVSASCTDNAWQVQAPLSAMCDEDPFETPCPDVLPTGACDMNDPSCWSPEGPRCACNNMECLGPCVELDPPEWRCVVPPEESPCPVYPPNAGTVCDLPADTSCSYGNGDCENVYNCMDNGAWSGPNIHCLDCNAPGTPIATPFGDRPIESLQVGDLVYSMHESKLAVVPIAAVGRKPQEHHTVVALQLESGVTLHISPSHPTADGRMIGQLSTGDTLDGHEVLEATLVPYTESHTYDILPDSDSGTYLAGGALIGSTLYGVWTPEPLSNDDLLNWMFTAPAQHRPKIP